MPAARHNITIEQGSDYTLQMTLESGGNPVNLAGSTVRGQIRPAYDSDTVTSFTVAVASPATGVAVASLTAAQTAALTAGNNVYDFELEDSGHLVRRLIYGKAVVTPEVTR